MTSDATPPAAVISGLAAGAGFVVVFSIFLTPSLMNSNSVNSTVVFGEQGQTISKTFQLPYNEI